MRISDWSSYVCSSDLIDAITRNALRSATLQRTEQAIGDELDPNAWQRDLMDRLAASPGIEHSRDAELVAIFTRQIFEHEVQLPLAINRAQPLGEIEQTQKQDAVDRQVTNLTSPIGRNPTPNRPY